MDRDERVEAIIAAGTPKAPQDAPADVAKLQEQVKALADALERVLAEYTSASDTDPSREALAALRLAGRLP